MRGEHSTTRHVRPRTLTIPTCVGSTQLASRSLQVVTIHVRGEHEQVAATTADHPHVRGEHGRTGTIRDHPHARGARASAPDHPHVRGEHVSQLQRRGPSHVRGEHLMIDGTK